MLRLPGDDDEPPPLVIPGSRPSSEHSPTAQPEEGEDSGDGDLVTKRRRRNLRSEEIFDETFPDKQDIDPKLVRGIIGSVGVLGAIILTALIWPEGERPESATGDLALPPPVKGEKSEGPSDEDLAAERQVVPPPFAEEKLLPVIRNFLEAETAEEMARWVRHPEVTLPRIEAAHPDGFESDGFSRVLWARPPMRTGNSIRVVVEDGGFSAREIHLVEEDGWKVDWESWEGWSELPWKEMEKERPTEAVTFRVMVSDVGYYNFEFTDEAQWSCYRLESREGQHALFGYAPRAGEVDARLRNLDKVRNRPFILKLRYPENSSSGNQVIIDGIIAEGWMAGKDES